MSSSSRNFIGLDVSRSRSTSGPASKLSEIILLKLEVGTFSIEDLIRTIEADPTEVRGQIEALLNLKLLQSAGRGRLRISSSGKTALAAKLVSV
jgi:hypothetical protein